MITLFEPGWKKSVVRGVMLGSAVCGMLALRPGPISVQAESSAGDGIETTSTVTPFGYMPKAESQNPVDQLIIRQMDAQAKRMPAKGSCCGAEKPAATPKASCCSGDAENKKCSLETNGCDGTKPCCGTDHCTCGKSASKK